MVLAEIFGWDMLIVLAVVALLFGGAKLPKLARSLGSAKGEFEKGLKEGDRATAAALPAESAPSSVTEAELAAAAAEARAAEARARADALQPADVHPTSAT